LKPDRLKSDGSKAAGAQTVEGLTAGVQADEIQADEIQADEIQADEIQADEYLNDGTLTDLPAATADQPAVSTLGEMFRQTSKETLDYVFHQGLGIAELFALVTVYLVFLFLGSRRLPGKIRRAFPGERGERLLLIGAGISDSMERFMAVKTTVGLGMAVSAGLIMYFFGLDHWLLWAFLFFASNYITYIGSIAALVPPFLLAFIDLNGPLAAAALAALLVVNRLIWIDIVEVRMSGRQLNLDPALMFLWLSYWGWVWGVLGLLLAYPMLAAVKIVLAHLRGGEGWAVMLSDE
jgi:predicted PurR-regulated permease PerM